MSARSLSYASAGMTRAELQERLAAMAAGEQQRHDRIAAVIESTVLTGFYEVIDVTGLS
jgi:hypothetical protein